MYSRHLIGLKQTIVDRGPFRLFGTAVKNAERKLRICVRRNYWRALRQHLTCRWSLYYSELYTSALVPPDEVGLVHPATDGIVQDLGRVMYNLEPGFLV